jgi:hypothetical protein
MLGLTLLTHFLLIAVHIISILHKRNFFTVFCTTRNKHFYKIITDCKTILQVFYLEIWCLKFKSQTYKMIQELFGEPLVIITSNMFLFFNIQSLLPLSVMQNPLRL